jgi:hypothetical protein
MNRRQADKKAKATYGPLAAAVRPPGEKDRNQRFGIVMTEPAGLGKEAYLICLGYGPSFEAAFDMAATNPVASMAADRWANIQADWEQFGKDPKSVLERFRSDFEKLGKAINHGHDQREGPEVHGDEQPRGEGERQG